MGQGACCDGRPNDPNLVYYNSGKPLATTTPVKTSRRSQRDLGTPRSSKYRQSQLEPEVSPYVKEKMRDLPAYESRSSKKISGESRPATLIESSGVIYRGEWKDE